MCVQDVSNYLAVFDKMVEYDENEKINYYDYKDVKLKGCFEIDKELNKDPGMRIVPIALKEYFINKVPIYNTITNHDDILDFCLELKVSKDWSTIYKFIDENGMINEKTLGRITRYYVSGNSSTLIKQNNEDDRTNQVAKGYGFVIFNKYNKQNIEDYKINYNYYIHEAYKIINKIENKQLKLFN